MRFIFFILFALATTGCAPKAIAPPDALMRRCAPILEEILQVQDLRSLNNLALQSKRQEGALTDEIVADWRALENELGGRANQLYAKAERKRCFRVVENILTSS